MLELGPVRIEEHELRWMSWSQSAVVLAVNWGWREVPVLLDLAGVLLMRWGHIDDREAGFPLHVKTGTVRYNRGRNDSSECMVLLELVRVSAPESRSSRATDVEE